MRIGVVTDNYFPSVGGTEISISNYSQELQAQGHEVFIFCPSLGLKNPKKSDKNVIRLPSLRRIYPDHPLMLITPGITRKFRSYNLDIIHSQTPISAPYVAEYISQNLDIPHIHTMHTLVPEQVRRGNGSLLKTFLLYLAQSFIIGVFSRPKHYLLQDERQTLATKVRFSWIYMLRLIRIPDKLIVPSKHVAEILHARGFENSIELLPTFSNLFINTNKSLVTKPKNKYCKILYVGRLDNEKRAQVVIDAVNLLPRSLKWRLTIVGTGKQRSKLRRLVKKYKLNDRVTFTGSLSRPKTAKELLRADIFVLPSYRFDTQAIALLEACSAGLPIVYCDNNLSIGVERRNSILTKPYARNMSQGIEKLIRNEKLRQKLAAGSLEVDKKYRPDKLTRKLLRIYKRATLEYYSARASEIVEP